MFMQADVAGLDKRMVALARLQDQLHTTSKHKQKLSEQLTQVPVAQACKV